jgi:hypothetical protein
MLPFYFLRNHFDNGFAFIIGHSIQLSVASRRREEKIFTCRTLKQPAYIGAHPL